MTQRASDYAVVPMTRAERREYHDIGRESFATKCGLDFVGLCNELREE
ncbi:hypothetical protein SBA3_910047 [Candidatus Sulfopaludibacter sp. SbA3]|nr:hypothetical protein SBA3_910047 [Candidatus Sulfopaludibacter sp. SbA3]